MSNPHWSVVHYWLDSSTSPSACVGFSNIYAADGCGVLSTDGQLISSTIIAFAPGELSTIEIPAWIRSSVPPKAAIRSFNFADLPCPPQSVMVSSNTPIGWKCLTQDLVCCGVQASPWGALPSCTLSTQPTKFSSTWMDQVRLRHISSLIQRCWPAKSFKRCRSSYSRINSHALSGCRGGRGRSCI